MLIAYDIDGVLIGELLFKPIAQDLTLAVRNELSRPLFQPQGDYYLITGRPQDDREATLAWIKRSLTVQPRRVFHDCRSLAPGAAAQYKGEVLLAHPEIDLYVENELEICDYLQTLRVTHPTVPLTVNLPQVLTNTLNLLAQVEQRRRNREQR